MSEYVDDPTAEMWWAVAEAIGAARRADNDDVADDLQTVLDGIDLVGDEQ